MKASEIAAHIATMRAAYVYATIGGVGLSMHPKRADLLKAWDLPSRGHLHTGRKSKGIHKISLNEYFEDGWGEGVTNLTILRVMPSLMVLEVWDMIKQLSKPLPPTPHFEFLFHVRNAIAHNSKIHIIRKMRGPAHFDGIEIKPEHHGTPLSDLVAPGDLLALLDALEAELLEA
ncbi:hypothetical protein M1D89_19500 [Arthrobacter sp. D3-18]